MELRLSDALRLAAVVRVNVYGQVACWERLQMRIPCTAGAVLLLVQPGFGFAQSDFAKCLDGARRFKDRYERFAARIELKDEALRVFDEEDGSIPVDRAVRISTFRLKRDGNAVHVFERTRNRSMNKGQIDEYTQSAEWLVKQELILTIPRDPKNENFEGLGVAASKSPTAEAAAIRGLDRVAPFLLKGSFDFLGPPISERLLAAEPKAVTTEVDRGAALRIDFEDDWGVSSAIFERDRSYQPKRVQQSKSEKHWIRPEVRIKDLPENPNSGILKSIDSEFLVMSWCQVGGIWFADQFEVRTIYTSQEGKVAETKITAKLSDHTILSAGIGSTFRAETHVPNGTRITLNSEPQISYEWRDGEMHKSVAQPTAKILESQEFKNDRWWWVRYAIMIGVAAFCLLGLSLWRRQRLGGQSHA